LSGVILLIKKPRGFPVAGRKRTAGLDFGRPEGLLKEIKTTGEVRPWQKNYADSPGSNTRRGADSQQAHPFDLFADKFSILVHKLARLLSVIKLQRVYHDDEEESRKICV
jgi:hypothetical protein